MVTVIVFTLFYCFISLLVIVVLLCVFQPSGYLISNKLELSE